MTIESILTFAIAVGALAIKPGAGMMMVMSRSIAGGWPACLAFVSGFCVVSLLFLGFVVLGYRFVAVDMTFISILIKSLAAVYLIFMGIKGLQTAQDELILQKTKVEGIWDNFSSSVMLTLSNPLTIVFYAGILPTVLDVQSMTTYEIAIIAMVIIAVGFAVAIAYCAPLILFRYKFEQKSLKGLKIFSSLILILVGLYIGFTAINAQDLLTVF